MKTLRGLFLTAAALAVISLTGSAPARADSLLVGVAGLSTGHGGLEVSTSPGGTEWSGYSFTLGSAYSNVSILNYMEPEGHSANITAWLTNAVGNGAKKGNVLYSKSFHLTGIGAINLTPTGTLAAGKYDVLFSQGPGAWGDASSFLLDPVVRYSAPGVKIGDFLHATRGGVDRGFAPGSKWKDSGDKLDSPVLITGNPSTVAAVPEPGTLVLVSVGGLLLIAMKLRK